MNIPPLHTLLLIPFCLSALCCGDADPRPASAAQAQAAAPAPEQTTPRTIALQPFGAISGDVIDTMIAAIGRLYEARVYLLPPRALPQQAYFKPRNRYRADTLLRFLDSAIDAGYTKVLGITDRDISATKGNVADWGILGLGQINARACMISTFRMKWSTVPQEIFFHRLTAVTIHELGHTFGLDHCPNQGCVMEDAKGSVATVDHETGAFCARCRSRLRGAGIIK